MPTLVSYRDGHGPWQTQSSVGGDYQLHVTNDFQFLVVCADSTGFDAREFASTSSEVSHEYVLCSKNRVPVQTLR